MGNIVINEINDSGPLYFDTKMPKARAMPHFYAIQQCDAVINKHILSIGEINMCT